jgi:hypothetical protein
MRCASVRPAMLVSVLVVVAATGVAACVGGGSVGTSSLGARPSKVGNSYLCPAWAPVVAFGKHFIPGNFPSAPPRTRRPTGCLASVQKAARAGLSVEPTPAGDLLIGGVYLTPPSDGVKRLCDSAAKSTGLITACPTLIPGSPDSMSCAGVFPCALRGAVVLEGNFDGPPNYVGDARGSGHLWIFTIAARLLRARPFGPFPADTLSLALGARVVRRLTFEGHPARFLEFPNAGEDLNAGHVVLIWRAHGAEYAVSLHGHTRLNEQLDLTIAAHLTYARPG